MRWLPTSKNKSVPGEKENDMITISDAAADKIKEILNAEGVPDHGLRVTAASGGCCGPSYEIMIDDKSGDGDTVVEMKGTRLFLDASTAKALDGAELGFVSDDQGEGFALGFPNGAPAGGSCGCGEAEANPGRGGCGSGGCGCS
jgi:iron-sulfur cluster assembly accessory protein